ncbi:SMC-Scp complex subunit ScpB [Thalassobaculum sp.]|uniref:SMC-Scp complex subunit ScpB n=1 Tax=Thalassobaculum sp. TaxID=2022740 RepID=UPI0032EF92C7
MARPPAPLDTELADLEPDARWREWLGRVEAVIFASDQPVPREVLGRVVGSRCNLDMLLAELEAELVPRPYQLLRIAGGYALRTRAEHRDAIRTAFPDLEAPALTKLEATVLMAIAYYQPVTRDQVGWILGYRVDGRQIDRDLIGRLRRLGLIANGPRSPEPGAPILYVTTPAFLGRFGLDSLDALPEREKLEAAGLLDKAKLLAQRRALTPESGSTLPTVHDEDDAVEPLES